MTWESLKIWLCIQLKHHFKHSPWCCKLRIRKKYINWISLNRNDNFKHLTTNLIVSFSQRALPLSIMSLSMASILYRRDRSLSTSQLCVVQVLSFLNPHGWFYPEQKWPSQSSQSPQLFCDLGTKLCNKVMISMTQTRTIRKWVTELEGSMKNAKFKNYKSQVQGADVA